MGQVTACLLSAVDPIPSPSHDLNMVWHGSISACVLIHACSPSKPVTYVLLEPGEVHFDPASSI